MVVAVPQDARLSPRGAYPAVVQRAAVGGLFGKGAPRPRVHQDASADLAPRCVNRGTGHRYLVRQSRRLSAWARKRRFGSHCFSGVPNAQAPDPSRDGLSALGDNQRANIVIDEALKEWSTDPCILLSKANTFAGFDGWTELEKEDERLGWINQIYNNLKLAPLQRKDPGRPLAFDNIICAAPPCYLPAEAQPLISVLIPAYNAQATLRFTIESILVQSWRNLEIVIVDDKSPDATFELAQQLSREDPRVRAYSLAENSGAYVARNEALRKAQGEYITIHDADDWSHPQKLELQMRHLLENPTVPANCSDWVRCRFNLFFRGNARIGPSRVTINHSSILMRREIALQ